MSYKATQKTVKALALVLRYVDSAISRCDDDAALDATKATLRDVKATLKATHDVENATRIAAAQAEVAKSAPVDITGKMAAFAAAQAADIAAQAQAMADAIDAAQAEEEEVEA